MYRLSVENVTENEITVYADGDHELAQGEGCGESAQAVRDGEVAHEGDGAVEQCGRGGGARLRLRCA